MSYIIGTDEAGYGPNYGPLTICGTLWRADTVDCDLYHRLRSSVSPSLRESDQKICICDSKAIYSSVGSISQLETSVLATLHSLSNTIPKTIVELAALISRGIDFSSDFGWNDTQFQLPIAAVAETVRSLSSRFQSDCRVQGCQLVAVGGDAVFPGRFNQLIEKTKNKAELLSATTLGIVRQLLDVCNEPVNVYCDKHGGRSRYAGMLNQFVTDEFVQIEIESRESSVYRWVEQGREIRVHFQAKGESQLPTALASMCAKYFREVAMAIWNQYWMRVVPGIRPTQGYPVDAKRFRNEIQTKQLALGLSDESIWRSK